MIEIGKHLGKKIEFKNMEFHGLLAALASDNVDMVVAAMSVTQERLARVDFSSPYTDARIAVLYRKDDKFRSGEDLKDKAVGAQLGTIWTLIAHDMSSKYHFSTTKALSNNLMLVEELKNKRIDAIVLEESQVEKFIQKNSELASFPVKQYGSSFAIALPKGSPLKKNIDHTIKALKRNGTIDALSKKWGVLGAQ
jgi:polar amino acid transport system substrate-binding protein